MKKALILSAICLMIIPCAFGAGVASEIDAAVEKKMQEIRNSGKSGQNVEEIKFKRRSSSDPVPEASATPVVSGYIGTLSALNIVGGIFEGGVIGMSIGLIGYSQSMNRNIDPVINGSIIGVVSGAVLGAALSAVQLSVKRYYLSDDYGYNVMGGTLIGAAIGAAGGVINWQRTGHLENVSEGAGYGSAAGAIAGLITAVVETFLPDDIRGGSFYEGGTHASLRQLDSGSTVLSLNFKY